MLSSANDCLDERLRRGRVRGDRVAGGELCDRPAGGCLIGRVDRRKRLPCRDRLVHLLAQDNACLLYTSLDSALEAAAPEAAASAADTPPHEDHDVKRYQPKRQRDHATEEEVEKWNETKANAKRLAKKGISGLKHFASKLSERCV